MARRVLLAGLAGLIVVVTGCGGGGGSPPGQTAEQPPRTTTAPRAEGSPAPAPRPSRRREPSAIGRFWGTPVAADASLDPRSDALVNSLVSIVDTTTAQHRPPWMAISTCADPVYTVPAGQPTVMVELNQEPTVGNASLRAALTAVPLPAGAVASKCPDQVIIVSQPSRNRMWELWHARYANGHWIADWGGATRHASTNDGSYGPSDWPGAHYNWGTSASSLTLYGGMIRLDELRRGRIDHAVSLSLPEVAAGRWAAPAQRTDGTLTAPDAIPYGARFRLDPRLDVDALHLSRVGHIIARAAQRYGFVVRESTHCCVSVTAESPTSRGRRNPYLRYLDGSAGNALANFPWRRLELLRMQLNGAGA